MQFKITLHRHSQMAILPINYQYPLSAAIYKIMEKADAEYANFLHEKGYGKGYKFFTFSDIKCPFRIKDDRLHLLSKEMEFIISFHLPEASQHFIQGLFQSEQIDIADKKSKVTFQVKSVEALPNILSHFKENELLPMEIKPLSPIVAGVKNEKGNYDYLHPEDKRFAESLLFNWREKIKANYNDTTAKNAFLSMNVNLLKNPAKSRLITIKAGTPAETKIRGFINFQLNVHAEKRFLEILMNCGVGLYNAQGMGSVEGKTKMKQDEPV